MTDLLRGPTRCIAAPPRLLVCAPLLIASAILPAVASAESDVPAQAAQAAQAQAERLREENAALRGRIDTLEQEIASLRGRLEERSDSEARLARHIDSLRARLPAPEGGSITAEEARASAEASAAELGELLGAGRGINNPQLWRRIREAENALHRTQFLVARAESARTVYRVRPGDTLELIGRMFYGEEDRWSEIYDTNRHVVEDPAALLPGITLVIP
jgi:nucleoid-associated protein YgaU